MANDDFHFKADETQLTVSLFSISFVRFQCHDFPLFRLCSMEDNCVIASN